MAPGARLGSAQCLQYSAWFAVNHIEQNPLVAILWVVVSRLACVLAWRFLAGVCSGEPCRADVACWGGWGPHTPCARQIGPHPPQPTPPSRHGSLRCVWGRKQKSRTPQTVKAGLEPRSGCFLPSVRCATDGRCPPSAPCRARPANGQVRGGWLQSGWYPAAFACAAARCPGG